MMKADCYCLFSIDALTRLLNRAASGSAEHRAIRDELRRRELTKPLAGKPLLFTGEELSRASSARQNKVRARCSILAATARHTSMPMAQSSLAARSGTDLMSANMQLETPRDQAELSAKDTQRETRSILIDKLL